MTQLSRIGWKVSLRLLENRLAHETGKRADRTPLQAKRLERGTGTLESEPQWKERRYLRIVKPLRKTRELANPALRYTHCEKELTIS